MILIFHLSKHFFLNLYIILKINNTTPDDLHGNRLDDLQYLRRLRRLTRGILNGKIKFSKFCSGKIKNLGGNINYSTDNFPVSRLV